MPGDLFFDLGPTQSDFCDSDEEIVQIIGPMGEGKTYAGVVGLIAHAQRCRRDIRTALVRDTFQNIKTSTKQDIEEYLQTWVEFRDGGKHMLIHSEPKVYCDLFGIDDESSISKLQGPQYACIWLEEPAPIYEKANAGLPIGVFNMAVARAARQAGTRMRVQITQNPSDEEHWTALLAEEPYIYMQAEDPGTGKLVTIRKKTLFIRKGENRYLNPMARIANQAAFKYDKAKWTRYVEGETATVYKGKKVTPGYSPKIHFSEQILPVQRGELIQMWDSWSNPTCILAQYTDAGQLVFHDVCYDQGIGAEELCDERLDLLLNSPKYKGKVKRWRIMGDQTMRNMDQSSSRNNTAKMLSKRYKTDGRPTPFEPGPVHWSTIKQPLNRCFKRLLNDGQPVVRVSRSATRLNRALRGGWHYKVDMNQNIIGNKPEKNDDHCHVGDAFANGIAILMPYQERKTSRGIDKAKQQRLARSYGGGSYSRTSQAGTDVRTGFGIPG